MFIKCTQHKNTWEGPQQCTKNHNGEIKDKNTNSLVTEKQDLSKP